jgi:arginyl-tRNA synthetase
MDLDKLKQIVWEVLLGLFPDAESQGVTAEKIVLERPKNREHGDWATNVAMQVWKQLGGANPREFATGLVAALLDVDGIKNVDVAGPGFINITLNAAAAAGVVPEILKKDADFGRNNTQNISDSSGNEAPQRVNLEFVSANPTGPVHLGGGRWAAVGDALARVLEFSGAKVEREYYFNDHGTQIDRFAASLLAGAFDLPAPEDGYGGEYISQIASQVLSDHPEIVLPDGFVVPDQSTTQSYKDAALDAVEALREYGVQLMFPAIKQTLDDFGVHFDTFFHEQSLYDDGKVKAALQRLDELGVIYKKEGATWLETTKFGDDKDRVIIKSNGEEAYIMADIAYYLDKRSRADKAIYILGADHGGYVGRLHAVARAFGDEPGKNIVILLGQLVNLVKNGEPVRMSKRAGNIITLDDLVEAVGLDAARYSLARSSSDSPLTLDLDLLSSHKLENPVYYVQYAFARTRNVLRNYLATGAQMPDLDAVDALDLGLLSDSSEEQLLATLVQFPGVVAKAANQLEPHRVARYLEELSAAYHSWYAACRVVGDDVSQSLSHSRIVLNEATSIVLRNGLNLLGVSAPERM